ncbi:MAG TPA: sigma-70 family RNA polymerase sigma factor [Candidatus Merdisoma faecalis]|uniref:RNA polymerase sigma factor n=1 Tax=Lachnoclostridium sp. An138 TaxID=1965560 RepID=UPI000B385938|nr:sigma-70 family RNA polymerase sigma factor [Lachnoclostridium sp. An138]OUQ18816.1 RNA polymerase subunit sigma [Lachnoclostridium sp. An138]HIR98336.1 sigma-70 family RNA polymerase sigma factor [Candidatus Merdisoma faecalis]
MRQSLEELIEAYQKSLYAAAFNICRNTDDANDVVQDTFIQYYTTKKQFQDEEHLKAWLLRVAINRAKDISRSFWKKNRLSIEDYADAVPFESREETGLFEAVMRLPEKYREVIHLYYYEDLSIKETARILRITEGSVKMRLSRGRSFLRDVFKEEES